MEKIFTTIVGVCPLKGFEQDSQRCRACEFYFRAGTGTFFWCRRPQEPKKVEGAQVAGVVGDVPKRKRGRPKGSKSQKPVKRAKSVSKKER